MSLAASDKCLCGRNDRLDSMGDNAVLRHGLPCGHSPVGEQRSTTSACCCWPGPPTPWWNRGGTWGREARLNRHRVIPLSDPRHVAQSARNWALGVAQSGKCAGVAGLGAVASLPFPGAFACMSNNSFPPIPKQVPHAPATMRCKLRKPRQRAASGLKWGGACPAVEPPTPQPMEHPLCLLHNPLAPSHRGHRHQALSRAFHRLDVAGVVAQVYNGRALVLHRGLTPFAGRGGLAGCLQPNWHVQQAFVPSSAGRTEQSGPTRTIDTLTPVCPSRALPVGHPLSSNAPAS